MYEPAVSLLQPALLGQLSARRSDRYLTGRPGSPKQKERPSVRLPCRKHQGVGHVSDVHARGRRVSRFDSYAYHHISSSRDVVPLSGFRSKVDFDRYLRGLPEYRELQRFHETLMKRKICMIMAGSACQDNDRCRNSYLEIEFNVRPQWQILARRHTYQPGSRTFRTSVRRLPLPRRDAG